MTTPPARKPGSVKAQAVTPGGRPGTHGWASAAEVKAGAANSEPTRPRTATTRRNRRIDTSSFTAAARCRCTALIERHGGTGYIRHVSRICAGPAYNRQGPLATGVWKRPVTELNSTR